MRAGIDRYARQCAGPPPTSLLTGARVRAKGTLSGGTLALAPDRSGLQTVAPAPAPATLGAQRTLVMLVTSADAPTGPYTAAESRSVVFDTTSRFFLENSFQQTWLDGDVAGWFAIASSSAACDTAAIASQAEAAAAAAGIDVAAYQHFVYAVPRTTPATSADAPASAAVRPVPGSTVISSWA